MRIELLKFVTILENPKSFIDDLYKNTCYFINSFFYEDVIGLEIAVDNTVLQKLLETCKNLGQNI